MNFQRLSNKLEFGDALLFFYVAVFARQCFWAVESDAAAWSLTLAASALVWLAHVITKPEVEEKTPRVFWLTVALPIFAVYALRVAYPDTSFDVLSNRLIQGERSLRGVQLPLGDFFPTNFPLNPSSDMLTGIFRHLLGYRLGTVISLLALVWAGTVLEKLLRPFVAKAAWRCLGVLLVLFTEHVLFEVNNYMVDLLALPLILEATRLALGYDESKTKSRDLIFSSLLLGASVALKLTNAAMVAPVLILFAVRALSSRPGAKTLGFVLLAAVCFLLPILPHAVYIYGETGSPVFPLYNKILGSPYWPLNSPYDGRWGPRGWSETLLWPLLTLSVPERLSELGVYSGRVMLGLVAAVPCLLLPRIATRARLLAFAVLLASPLWSLTSGYVRYALFLEILGGMLVIYLATYAAGLASRWPRALRLALVAVPLCLLAAQCLLSAGYVLRMEWSRRPTVFDEPDASRKELGWVLRDRDLLKFQTAENRALFGQVDAWVVSDVKTNGVEALLRPRVPILGVNYLEYFDRKRSRERFERTREPLRGKRVYTLAMAENLGSALGFLRRRRFEVGQVTNLNVRFFSTRTQFGMALIELGLPEKHQPPQKPPGQPLITELDGPLGDDAFRAELSADGVAATIPAGQKAEISVTVKNLSEYVWPARSRKGWTYQINVADTWLDTGGSLVNGLDGRSALPRDLWPGESAEVTLTIKAPEDPGDYLLEIDVVQEGVTFFKEKDSEPLRVRITVE